MNPSLSDPSGLLQISPSRWAKAEQDYSLILSGLQYSLKHSILISSDQDIKCKGEIAVEPYVHQVENLKQFLNNYPQRLMLLDEVGLGKTISAGLILTELLRRRRITNFLVVCPAILLDQWRQELEEKFRLRDLRVGSWQRLGLPGTADPETLKIITTYNAVVDHQDFFLKRKWDFVVADEGDYLKNLYTAGGFKPSARARTFYEMLKEGRAEFFLLLTATPLRRNLWDVFNLAEITSQPGVNPIGTPQSFARVFIADDPAKARRIPEAQHGEFRRRLTEVALRTSRKELKTLVFPERKVQSFAVPLSEAKRTLLDLTTHYLHQRYNFLRRIEPDEIKKLISNWKRALESHRPGSWEQLKVISDEVANRLGEYAFTIVSPSGERYTTSLSYELVSQALLAFIERVKPWVTTLTDWEKIHQVLSVDMNELVERFFEEEIKRRRPNKLEEISLLQSVLSSPAAAVGSFQRKRAKSALKYERDLLDSLIHSAEAIHEPEKAKHLLHLAQKLREERPHDYRLLVFTIRRETQAFLGEYLEGNGFKNQICYIRGGCSAENIHSQQDFTGVRMESGFGPPRKHILISTDAGSAGVNLQACNTMVNYDLPWVPMTIEQRIGRIQRIGQAAKNVIVNNFYIAHTIDQTIVMRLMERIKLFELAIGELEAILPDAADEEDFEERIFEYVMLSKDRRDEEVARQLERMNRDDAIQRLKKEQEKNEELLGTLLSSKEAPRFRPRDPGPPRLEVPEFCRTAFQRLGFRTEYHPDKDLLYVEFKRPTQLLGNWEHYTFTETDRGDNGDVIEVPRLLGKGTKEFEKLLKDVLNVGGVVIRSCEPLEQISDEKCLLEDLKQNQVDSIRPVGLRSRTANYHVAWRLTWKAMAAVARDRFEKLLQAFLPGEDKMAIKHLSGVPAHQLEALPLWKDRDPGIKPPDKAVVAGLILAEARKDEELLSFEEHYAGVKRERIEHLEEWFNKRSREEGLRLRATSDLAQERAKRIQELEVLFTPSAEGTVAMVEGFVYRVLTGEVECTLERNGESLRFVAGYDWVPLSHTGQVRLECRECRRNVQESFEVCKAGHLACAEHAARCAHPTCTIRACRRCARGILELCDAPGVYACSEHLKPCPSCGNRALVDLLFTVEEIEQPVCPLCFEVCEETGTRHLLSELERSDLSQKLVYHALLHTCPVSGRRGLAEEMEAETGTGKLHSPEALCTCEASGGRVAPGKLVASELSGRLCLPEYLQRCAVSGIAALPDELEVCAETSQKVDPRQLATCAASGKVVLKTVLVSSPVSGRLFLPRYGVADEMTGDLCLPDEIAPSAVSGRKVRRDCLIASELGGRLALPYEMVVCPETGKRVCRDELLECQNTGIRAIPLCFGTDEVTGKRVLGRRLVTCAVTRKRVLREHTKECVLTGHVALTSECEQCAQTGQWVLRGKLEPSDASGKRVLPALLRTSKVSGKRALPEEMARCEETGEFALPQELETCQVSRKRVLPTSLSTCPDTGRRFLAKHGGTCAKSGALVHPDALGISEPSGLVVRKCLLEQSEVSDRRALPEDMQNCAITGRRVLPGELATCEISGRRMLPKFLMACAICARESILQGWVLCRGCLNRYCERCVSVSRCGTCLSLRRPLRPLDSLPEPLRKAVLDAYPAASRVAMSQNAKWELVYAEPRRTHFWEASRLLVFKITDNRYTLMRENREFKI